jgi:hypothetical protein
MPTVLYQSSVRIPKGTTTSPALAVPTNLTTTEIDVDVTRDNWPSAGCDLSLSASYDGGVTYQTVAGPQHIDPFVPTTKQPTPTPARIGFSWSADMVPTHVKGTITAPSAFNATLTVVSPD